VAKTREQLPSTFSFGEARAAGLSKHKLYALRDAGRIELLSRGLYRRTDATVSDLDLIEIAKRAPLATLCLTTALVRHGLSDEIPASTDVALPRGRRNPVTSTPVTWHQFDRATFEIGRKALRLDSITSIGLYTPERCIIDAFRTRASGGHELANDALKRWLKTPGAHPASLLRLAASFPRTVAPIRRTLEIVL
jgi:predicted transcriptional regulator of viral defense system